MELASQEIMQYKCLDCGHEGTTRDLFAGRLCPDCKKDVYHAYDRARLVDSAINQTHNRMYEAEHGPHTTTTVKHVRRRNKWTSILLWLVVVTLGLLVAAEFILWRYTING